MAQGVKCDVESCTAFGELPIDPMGGFQPVGDWIEIKMVNGRYHACGSEHAAIIARDKLAQQQQNALDSEQHAQLLQDQASAVRGTVEQ